MKTATRQYVVIKICWYWIYLKRDKVCLKRASALLDWLLVGCFGFNGSLRQYFSLYRAVSQREGERRERIDVSKNVQTTPTRTHCKRNRPLPYCNQYCRTPRHWKFTQHHRTTRPPPALLEIYINMYQYWWFITITMQHLIYLVFLCF